TQLYQFRRFHSAHAPKTSINYIFGFFLVGFLWEMIHLMRDLVFQMNIVMRMKVFLLMRHHQAFIMKLLIEESKHLVLY
ncbi:hypothetical protein Gotri_022197, partial [Gossypium trilobum]|nr:hypothetical protein [Gossypium trilobum]